MTAHKTIGPALHREPRRAELAALKAQVLEISDDVFDRYVWGESFKEIAVSLPFEIAGWKLRQILTDSEETADHYTQLEIIRSHNLIDDALAHGRKAAAIGDVAGLKTAIDVNLKVAGKLNTAYNDKATVEHTGKGGGPIQLLAMTDEQLLAIAAKGLPEAAE